jgi:hypothetical protein
VARCGARRIHAPINRFDILESPDDLEALAAATAAP